VHHDGTAWSPLDSVTTEWLEEVWGSDGSNITAVGGGGTILHYGGERRIVHLPRILKQPPYPDWPP
jgi:hypothetical protein